MSKIYFFILSILLSNLIWSKNITTKKLEYIENKGQWENTFLYKVDLHNGGWAFLEKNAITYKFIAQNNIHPHDKKNNEIINGHAIKVKWLNANTTVKINGNQQQPNYNNYFIGKDSTKWKTNVGIYNSVYYTNIYPNIDFNIYSNDAMMKSDYIIKKNGNPSNLKFIYEGVDNLKIEDNGNLKITTSINTLQELKPYAYQIINGKEKEIACKYKLYEGVLSFELTQGYNKTYDLIIDPTLVFSTYSGSYSDNWGSSATHDNNGNMFLGGIALGALYPTTLGAFQTSYNGGSGSEPTDVVITKINTTGTARIYSTFIGGSSNELLSSLLCTPKNELIAIMTTSSPDFPTTPNAYSKTFSGGISKTAYEISLPFGTDIAVSKFNTNGTALIGSTYFGGKGNDGLNSSATTAYNYGDESRSDVAIDNAGNIYITSTTTSGSLPGTTGTAQPIYGGGESDGFIAKFNSNLSSLNWATYFGGKNADAAYSIELDKNNNIFICGGTASTNIPGSKNGLNNTFQGGNTDGFVAKLNNNGTSILASTYLGTGAYDQAYILDLDNANNVCVFGQTLGNYPVTNGVYFNTGGKQFLHKLNNNLNANLFSTVFGSINAKEINISPTALMVDNCGNIYAVGWGGNVNREGNTNNMAVTADAYKKNTDGSDFYLINLNADATTLKYATYFGEDGGIGDHVDGGTSRFDKNGIVYQAVCASCGGTNGFPVTAGAVSSTNNSFNCNMAGFKFKFDLTALQIITATATPSNGCSPLNVTFNYTATVSGTKYFWDFGDNTTSSLPFPSHTYNNAGTYTVRFILEDPTNCNPIDSTTLTINVETQNNKQIDSIICQGKTVIIGNQTFSKTGIYTLKLQNINGCDSIITLNLTVNKSIITNLSKIICQNDSIQIGNHVYTKSGYYSDTLQAFSTCDSIVNLALTVIPINTFTITRTVCRGQSVTVNNQTFWGDGNYTLITKSSLGCDSIIQLTIITKDTLYETINKTICNGQRYTIGNNIYTQSGFYSTTIKAAAGCDSTIFLNLTVTDTAKASIQKTICEGDSIKVGNQIFNTDGNYTIVLPAASGCDSLIHLNIVIINKKNTEIKKEICEGDTLQIGNQQFTKNGNYTIPLKQYNGCDSIVHLMLTVNPLPLINAVSNKNKALNTELIQLNVNTNETFLSFLWAPTELVNNNIIQNPTAHITKNTWFTVIATNTISQCIAKDSVFIQINYLPCNKENIYIPNAFTPNGDGINDVFYVRSNILKNIHLEIYDRWGNKVFETDNITDGWDGTYKGQPATPDSYGYFIKGECIQNEKITLKGNVTLIR